jgi:hypothetical protein
LDKVNARLVNSLTIVECSIPILLEKGRSIFYSYPHSVSYEAHEVSKEGIASALVSTSLYGDLSIAPALAQQAGAVEQIAKADNVSTTIDAIDLTARKTKNKQRERTLCQATSC